MTNLEARAIALWERWGAYAKWTLCAVCDERAYCRAKGGKRYVCVDCFDQGHK
jgi:hypothetical protein